MPLVLAIEPDPRQAATLKRVVKGRVRAELVLVDSKDAALAALASRVPDLILVSALLPPRDEDDLTQHLKALDHAGHLQTLTIPLLAGALAEEQANGSMFGKFRRKKKAASIEGCDPDMFGEEIETYLQRAAEMRAEERAREAMQRESVFVEQAIVAEDAGQDAEQALGVVADMDQDFSPAFQEPDATELPVAPIERSVDLVEQDGEPARQEFASAPADAAALETQPAGEADIAELTYRPTFTGRLVIPFDRSRPPVEEPRSVLIEPQPVRDNASLEPQAELVETPVAQDDFTRTDADSALAQEPPAIVESGAAPSESGFVTAERDAPAGSALSIFMREPRTAEPQHAFAKAATFEAHSAFDEREPASAEPDAAASQDASATTFDYTSVVADDAARARREAAAFLEDATVAADAAAAGGQGTTPFLEAAVAANEPVVLEQDFTPVVTDARVELEPADVPEERVAFEQPPVCAAQEPADLSRDFVTAFDVATDPAIGDADASIVEPEATVDEQDGDGGDAERQLEPWEQLLRQIAAQQEALNAEAARAAEIAAEQEALNAEAARTAEMAAQQEALNAEAVRAAEMAAAEAAPAAAEYAEERATANPDLRLEVFDEHEAPAGILDSTDAEAAEPPMAEVQPEHHDPLETTAGASVRSDAPARRSTSAAVHSALTRALAPLHAFVGRVTSGRKSAAAAAVPADDMTAVTSAAPVESDSEGAFAPTDVTIDDLVLPDNAVEDNVAQPHESQVATLDAWSARAAGEDWHEVTPPVGTEAPIEREENVTLPSELPVGETAGGEAAAAEAASREDEAGPRRRSKDDGRKEKKRRRSRGRAKRAHDFESVLERLDGAWVASAIAALRVDIERLRQDTLAAVPMASANEPEPDGRESGGTAAAGVKGNGHDQSPDPAAESQPVEDEWGFYDPGRCGIQALMARLDAQAGDNGATQQRKASPMQHPTTHQDAGAVSPARAAAATAQQDRRPVPLAMWARAGEGLEYDPQYVVPAEPLPQMPGISPALRLPDHVAAVRYASGCRIRRVRVAPGPKRGREDKRQVVILSRKALDEAD